jgi:hypothetical protein
MARMTKRTAEPKPEEPQTDVVVGRELLEARRRESEEMADTLSEGEAVTYYDDGWRYGHVEKLPASDEKRYGEVRIMHQSTGRIWVAARDVRRLT